MTCFEHIAVIGSLLCFIWIRLTCIAFTDVTLTLGMFISAGCWHFSTLNYSHLHACFVKLKYVCSAVIYVKCGTVLTYISYYITMLSMWYLRRSIIEGVCKRNDQLWASTSRLHWWPSYLNHFAHVLTPNGVLWCRVGCWADIGIDPFLGWGTLIQLCAKTIDCRIHQI